MSILETVVAITVKLQVVQEVLLMAILVHLVLLADQVHLLADQVLLEQEDLVEAVEADNLNLLDLTAVLVK